MIEPIFSAAELADLRAYFAPRYFWLAIRDVVYLAVSLLTLKFLVQRFYAWAARAAEALAQRAVKLRQVPVARAFWKAMDRLWNGPGWGTALLFVGIDYLFFTLLYLPVDVYFGYVLEHRYHFATDSPLTYALDSAKGHAVTLLAWSFLAVGLFGLARKTRHWWWILSVTAVAGLSFSAALDPYRAQLYFHQTPLPAGPLREDISALLRKAEIDVAEILVVATSRTTVRVQAYFSGQGPTRTVTLTDTFVEAFGREEVLAAVAHEAGHIGESRWLRWLGTAVTLTGFLWFTHRLLAWAARRRLFGIERAADVRALPLLTLCFNLATVAVAPLSNALSRERETAADDFAVRLTSDPAAFKRMMIKAARINKIDPDPPRWAVIKNHTHPALGERLQRIEAPVTP